MKLLFSCCLVFAIFSGHAQKYTINGFVEDASSGERLVGASVYDARTFAGTASNDYGFFSLTLPADSVELTISYVGFKKEKLVFVLDRDTTLNFKISSSYELETFEVSATKTERIQERSQMSKIDIPISEIQNLPALLGEKDVLKTIQLLPGVQSGSEGTSGLYVRGGGPDQNLILLDGVPVYNASHLFGFFSVFNPDGINSVELIKGGFPAHYGGRLSSVIDIKMKEGNSQKLKGAGSVGLVSSKLTLEGPLIKDKSTFIISGRRTYIDILAQPIIAAAASADGVKLRAGYYFYDLNSKVNYKLSDKNRLFLSAYMGNDKAYFRYEDEYVDGGTQYTNIDKAGLGWGNITTALRWNSIINKKLFANTTMTYSRYRFLVDNQFKTETSDSTPEEDFQFEYVSGIYDWAGKIDFDYLPTPNHYIKFGVGNIYHTFRPGISVFRADDASNSGIDTTFGARDIYAHEFAAYAEDDMKIGARLKVNMGVHFSGFVLKKTDYYSVQPRISARYLLNEEWSVKASYATMQQYIHLLTNATIGLPTDLWVPSTDKIKPQTSEQVAAGVARTFRDHFEISIEGYYKTMNNLIEYKEGASFFNSSSDWEDKVEIGKGESYGGEFFIQKKTGKTRGWIGYTLSWTNRQFENLNFGKAFPYKFDRRHDIAIAITHKFSDKIDIGATWVYGTGNAITLATDRYASNYNRGNEFFGGFNNSFGSVEYFEERNDYRMASYHRLDAGINFNKEKKWGKRTWSLGVYNMYSRRNPFYLYFTENSQGRPVLKQVSLFPIIPSVSYSFSF